MRELDCRGAATTALTSKKIDGRLLLLYLETNCYRYPTRHVAVWHLLHATARREQAQAQVSGYNEVYCAEGGRHHHQRAISIRSIQGKPFHCNVGMVCSSVSRVLFVAPDLRL
jgi:hypothetical protein